MADEQTATQVDVQNPQEVYNQELSQAMAFALGNPDSAQLPAAPQQTENDASQASGSNAETKTNEVLNPFDSLKEKFGYQSQDDAIAEIEQLRQLKSNPPKQEFSFDNDDSRKLFDAIKTGDRKGVLAILEQQERLDSYTSTEINKDNAADIIKMGMQLKYKDLTPQEIDYKFRKQFAIPREPIQETLEDDDDFANRKSEWQDRVNEIEMEKVIEAKLLRPELETAKSKISLPNISDNSQQDYKAWLQQQQADEEADRVTAEAYKKFTPKDAATKMNFNDEANKITFEFQYEPDVDSFSKTIETLADFPTFLDSYKMQDGSPDRQRFLRDMHNGRNISKIVMEAMNQAKNATIKALALADNTGTGVVRELPGQVEESEVDKYMKMALAGYGGR